jgi:transposase
MLTNGRVTAAVFMDFLKRLLVNARTPIFVVVDGHPTHRAKSVARFVPAQAGKLALFFLPPYSPELNPDELVWNDLKNHGTWRKLITSLAQLRHTVVSHMRQLQKLPDLVRSFFTRQLRAMQAPNGIYFGRLIMMHLSLLRLANRSRPTSSQ